MNERLLAVVVGALAIPAVVLLVVRGFRTQHLDGPAKTARRRAVVTSLATAAATVGYAFLAPWPSAPEVRLATLPALTAFVGVALAGLAELTWPRPHGERRQASITVRRGTDARTLRSLFAGGLATSGVLLVIGSLTAHEGGRSIERSWTLGAAGAGPYPGLPYAVPIGLALAALALATAWSLRRVAARPALTPELEDVDRAVRLGATMRVLRVAAAGSLVTAAGLAGTMGFALLRVATVTQANAGQEAAAPPFDWGQNAGFLLIGLALAALVATVVALFAPSPAAPLALPAPSAVAGEAVR